MSENLNTQFVKMNVDQGIALVTIAHPPVNSLSPQVVRELDLIFRSVSENNQIRVLVLTGEGEKIFVAGADIKSMQAMNPTEAEQMARDGQRAFHQLETMHPVTICALNGLALGGGLELAMACDLRVCSDRAKLGQPEINLGIIPGFGGTQRLTRLVGASRAKEMILTGDPIDAAQALQWGLVNQVVPATETLAKAMELATKLAAKAPIALHYANKCINRASQMELEDGLKYEAASFGVIFGTQDKTEGITAFLDKRTATFKGH